MQHFTVDLRCPILHSITSIEFHRVLLTATRSSTIVSEAAITFFIALVVNLDSTELFVSSSRHLELLCQRPILRPQLPLWLFSFLQQLSLMLLFWHWQPHVKLSFPQASSFSGSKHHLLSLYQLMHLLQEL